MNGESNLKPKFYYSVIDTNDRRLRGALGIQEMFGIPNEFALVVNDQEDFFLIGRKNSISIKFPVEETEHEMIDDVTINFIVNRESDEIYVTIRLKSIKFCIESLY